MNSKLIYFLTIVMGAGLLWGSRTMENDNHAYIAALGFILLMFGLYKSTTTWVKDNPAAEEEKDINDENV